MTTSPVIAALEFASLPMLGWLAAALLPWLIHRWQRQQHKTTPWAAIELLRTAMHQRARTVHLQQWLLLVIRTAILAFVALAAAEPALRQWANGAGANTPTHRIFVLDQSYSMGTKHQGTSRWQRALARVRQQIKQSNGDPVTLIGWSDQTENLIGRPTSDTSVALATLENLKLSQASVELAPVARTILAAIKRAKTELPQITTHQVIFCTDLGRNTWQTNTNNQQLFEQIEQQAQITLVHVAEGPNHNLAVTNLTIEPAFTLRQRKTVITATLKSFGDSNPPTARVERLVELLVDGQVVGQQQVELNNQAKTFARFSYRFLNQGPHTVQAKVVDAKDPLSIDDTRWLVVDVQSSLKVACFAGQTKSADDLHRALAAGSSQAIDPELFSIHRLATVQLSDYAAILLSGVAKLSQRESAALTEYVRQGGGLALFLGPQTTPDTLRELENLLPASVTQTQPAGQFRFDPKKYRHPIVSPFRGQSDSGLLGVTVSQYCQLKIRSERQSLEVVLAFDTGDPALVIHRFDLGRVAISALPGSLQARTPDGTPWSSFALSPSFLPVVRELVTYLVGDRWLQNRNLTIGEPAIFPWDATKGSKTPTLRPPNGTRQTLPLPSAEDRGQLLFQETDTTGIYRFYADQQERARFAINLTGNDADLTPIPLDQLPFHASEDATTPSLATSHFSFTRILLASVLLLLLAEIGVAYQIGKGWK